MGHVLVKQGFNWADEIDLGGFEVTTQEEIDKHFHDVEFGREYKDYKPEPTDFPYNYYFGSNQFIKIKNMEDYKSYFEIIPITDDEANFLKRVFRYGKHGNLLYIE